MFTGTPTESLFLSPTLHKVLERVQKLRLQFRNLLGRSDAVMLGEAPKCFDFAVPLAVEYMARHTKVDAIAQLVQDALGQIDLGLIHQHCRTWQGDEGEARRRIHHCPHELGSDVKTLICLILSGHLLITIKGIA